jgi:hypothetical protein
MTNSSVGTIPVVAPCEWLLNTATLARSSHTHHTLTPLSSLPSSGIPSLPSPYLSSTVASFEARLAAYRARVEELERLQQPPGEGRDQLEHALPTVLHNVHTFFLHVAAQVRAREICHQRVLSCKEEIQDVLLKGTQSAICVRKECGMKAERLHSGRYFVR